MTNMYHGETAPLKYRAPAKRENSCLAVNLSMLGVGKVNEVHSGLVEAGISDPNGFSVIPQPSENPVTINGVAVIFGKKKEWMYDEDKADHGFAKIEADITAALTLGKAVITNVLLNPENKVEHTQHYILLAGAYVEDGNVTDIVVGDSLQEGVQTVPNEQVFERLAQNFEHTEYLFAQHVRVA